MCDLEAQQVVFCIWVSAKPCFKQQNSQNAEGPGNHHPKMKMDRKGCCWRIFLFRVRATRSACRIGRDRAESGGIGRDRAGPRGIGPQPSFASTSGLLEGAGEIRVKSGGIGRNRAGSGGIGRDRAESGGIGQNRAGSGGIGRNRAAAPS